MNVALTAKIRQLAELEDAGWGPNSFRPQQGNLDAAQQVADRIDDQFSHISVGANASGDVVFEASLADASISVYIEEHGTRMFWVLDTHENPACESGSGQFDVDFVSHFLLHGNV